MKILLVDDAPEMRRLLRRFLEREADLEVVGEASNGAEALEATEMMNPDVVVMDASMPVMDGIEATRQIAAKFPGIKVLGITGSEPRGMMEAGAHTALIKGEAHLQIVAALRSME
jgi:DNA-binding NarL/FixJ family response regulator